MTPSIHTDAAREPRVAGASQPLSARDAAVGLCAALLFIAGFVFLELKSPGWELWACAALCAVWLARTPLAWLGALFGLWLGG